MGTCIITGKEPYLIEKKVKETAAMVDSGNGLNVYYSTNAIEAVEAVSTVSFFSDRKLVVVRVEDLIEFDFKDFYTFYNSNVVGNDLLIVVSSIRSNLKISKAVSKSTVSFDKFKDIASLRNFCNGYLKNKKFATGAFEEFENRVQYLKIDEINLFNVTSELDKLLLLDKDEISVEDVKLYIEQNSYFNAFSLIYFIKVGDAQKAMKQVNIMLGGGDESSIGILSLLSRNYRLVYKAEILRFKYPKITKEELKKKVGVNFIDHFIDAPRALKSLNLINDAIERMKSGRYTDEEAIKVTVLRLISIVKEKQ